MSGAYPLTEEGLTAALAALGKTVDEVAETLLAGDYLGTPEVCNDCPAARYLQALFPEAAVEVHAEIALAYRDRPQLGEAPVLEVKLPRPVQEFVRRFDKAEFPRLRGPA